jgi:hypothetical protein
MYLSYGVNNSQTYSHKMNLKQLKTIGEWLFSVWQWLKGSICSLNSETNNWLFNVFKLVWATETNSEFPYFCNTEWRCLQNG